MVANPKSRLLVKIFSGSVQRFNSSCWQNPPSIGAPEEPEGAVEAAEAVEAVEAVERAEAAEAAELFCMEIARSTSRMKPAFAGNF